MNADRFGILRVQASSFLQSIGDNLGVCVISVEHFGKQLESAGLEAFFSADELVDSKKQLDSLAGRYAAKVAVREALGEEIAYKQIAVLSSSSGQPLVSFLSKNAYRQVFVSITHEDDLAGSVAVGLGDNSVAGVGVDVTRVARIKKVLANQPNVLSRIFTKREIAEMKDISEDAAIKWVGKEAVSKALGIGIWHGASLRDVEILTGNGEARVVLKGKWLEKAREKEFSAWRVGFVRDGEFVMGLVIARG